MSAFVTTQVDSTGEEHPEVRLNIPYRWLIFHREGSQFVSEVQIAIVARRDKRRVGGGAGVVSARVPGYESTRQAHTLDCQVPVQLRGDQAVVLDITVKIAQASRLWQKELPYDPRAARAVPVALTGFHWNLQDIYGPEPVLGIGVDSLLVELQFARRSVIPWPSGGVVLVATIKGRNKQDPALRRVPIAETDVGAGGLTLPITWQARDLGFGPQVLDLQLESTSAAEVAAMSLDPARRFLNLRVPWWDDQQWRQQVSWLDGIVEQPGRRELAATPASQRLTAWEQVWRQAAAAHGADAAALEAAHMIRIIEADERFSVFGPGSQTDRGKVYIRYGPPDRIEDYGDDLSSDSRWEVWYYASDRLRFTFYDTTGMGDFRLYEQTTY